ncbi:MAG: hypothetical protein MPW17_10305 [Candidatus Manganitrophus sp.]|nr:MAG: hypothetical protein MPW17_10305 [Candidatus Manganitrophus sp.]
MKKKATKIISLGQILFSSLWLSLLLTACSGGEANRPTRRESG